MAPRLSLRWEASPCWPQRDVVGGRAAVPQVGPDAGGCQAATPQGHRRRLVRVPRHGPYRQLTTRHYGGTHITSQGDAHEPDDSRGSFRP